MRECQRRDGRVCHVLFRRPLRRRLEETLDRHRALGKNVGEALRKHGTEAADPNVMARASVWLTTEMKMMVKRSDTEIAKIMMNGCNMGIQTITEKAHEFVNASEESKDLAERLVKEEEDFMEKLKEYLWKNRIAGGCTFCCKETSACFFQKKLRNLDKDTVILYYFNGRKLTKSWRDS